MRPPAASRATVVRDRPRDPAKTAAFAKSGLPFLVSSNNGCHFRPVAPIAQPLVEPVESQLRRLEPLSILPAQSPEELALFDFWLLWRYHYLPYSGASGENIKYLAFDCHARPLACLLYGAAAWKLAVRDQLIGWSRAQREANLCYVANNQRFLILPWVRVKNLASYLLSASLWMLSANWQLKYGHPIYLAETFVECASASGGPAIERPTGAGWAKLRAVVVTIALGFLVCRSKTFMCGRSARTFASV